MARVCPLFSGSTGNSYYIGSKSAGVLIDAGRSARQMEGMLKLCGIDPLAVHAILVHPRNPFSPGYDCGGIGSAAFARRAYNRRYSNYPFPCFP